MLQQLPIALAPALLIRILIFGASIGDAIALTALCALFAFELYSQTKRQVPVNKDILDRLLSMEELLKVTREKVNSVQFSQMVRK